jgi:hypothetical protein
VDATRGETRTDRTFVPPAGSVEPFRKRKPCWAVFAVRGEQLGRPLFDKAVDLIGHSFVSARRFSCLVASSVESLIATATTTLGKVNHVVDSGAGQHGFGQHHHGVRRNSGTARSICSTIARNCCSNPPAASRASDHVGELLLCSKRLTNSWRVWEPANLRLCVPCVINRRPTWTRSPSVSSRTQDLGSVVIVNRSRHSEILRLRTSSSRCRRWLR